MAKFGKLLLARKGKIERLIILIFCAFVLICDTYVLLFDYSPNRNALGALGTVCLDVFSMAVLTILVMSIILGKERITRTTRLFLGLMLASMVALFFDFLTWASDGQLEYGNLTYVYTVSSLVMGGILACFFVMYLTCYIDDMYDLKAPYLAAKICVALNLMDFCMTVVLALTKTAFIFVDGHYELGPLYDVVTVIPILTLLFMVGFFVFHVKVIGIHDIIAVSGYIFTMICGTLIEASYNVGATYVSVAVANLFIFIMLQNKLIDRVKKQREELAEEITSQYEILESMAGIYSYVNYLDWEEMTVRRFDLKDSEKEHLDVSHDRHSNLNRSLYEGIEDELKEKFWVFTDLSTLSQRMKGEKIIAAEFCHKTDGWFRAQYIRIGEDMTGPVTRVIYAIRNIDEEKKNVEKWIRKSNEDELTGFYNRHAYEDEITALGKGKIKDNLVYVSMDVNSLKVVNDTLGHAAGDELLVGACECMKRCFGAYGKLFRTGGDEFVALIYTDETKLADIKKDVDEVTGKWQGKLVERLTISCGYVTGKEMGDGTLEQMAALADKRMYEDKANYYLKQGIDRSGLRSAHVALCALYTKILKVNVTDDSYQIVNLNDEEQAPEKESAEKLSQWFNEFGNSGLVHPDDLEEYFSKANVQYISNYFTRKKSSLKIYYRRQFKDGYKRVVMEIIPTNDYTDENQSLFLYVRTID